MGNCYICNVYSWFPFQVETIGDAYMIVSGLPERNGKQHVREIAAAAFNILKSVITFRIPHTPDKQLQIRIGNYCFGFCNLVYIHVHLCVCVSVRLCVSVWIADKPIQVSVDSKF